MSGDLQKDLSPHSPSAVGRKTFRGSVGVTLADSLAVPAGLLIVIILTRGLGPETYGVFVLASSIVLWLEWTLASFFSRASVKMISDSPTPMEVASALVRWETGVGLVAGILLAVGAPWIAALLKEPAITLPLRLLAIDIPIFTAGQALRNAQVGVGRFDRRAAASATRSIVRLVLTLLLIQLGFSVAGAVLAMIGASIAEVIVVSRGLAFRWRSGSNAPTFAAVATYAVPTFLFAAAVRIFDRMDLLMFKALGASTAAAGLYGATLTATRIPMLLAGSIGPLVLASMSILIRTREREAAQTLARQSVRLTFLLLPFAVIGAGLSTPLLRLALGREYAVDVFVPSALIMAALGLFLLSIGVAILTAADRPRATSVAGGVMVIAALPAHLLMIPRLGAEGAAAVSATVAILAAAGTTWFALRVLGTGFPILSLLRCLLVAIPAWFASRFLEVEGPLVLLAVAGLSALAVGGLYLVREIGPAEVRLLSSLRPGSSKESAEAESPL